MFNVTEAAQAATKRGIGLAREGRFDEARMQFQHALELQPHDADAHFNLSNLFIFQGKLNEAIEQCQLTLKERPDHVEAHYNQGFALHSLGRREEAVKWYRQVLEIRPDHGDAQNGLGIALMEQGDMEGAAACFRQVLRFEPGHAQAHNNLGLVLLKLTKCEEAVACFQQALRLDPHHEGAQNNMGIALMELGRFDEAMKCFDSVLRLNPNFAEGHNNRGKCLNMLDRPDDAIQEFHQALRVSPTFAEAYCNLGTVHKQLGQFDAATDYYDKAHRLQPDHPAVHWSRSLLWLLLGDFTRGWPEYEWRWTQPGFTPRLFSQPLWDGSDLAGKTILLHSEQGLGDTIQFIRYAPLVKARGGRVIVECQRPLTRVLATVAGIDELVPQGDPLPPFDVRAEILSLAGIFRTSLDNIPADVPYLGPDLELADYWHDELKRCIPRPASGKGEGRAGAFKIGIAWQGSWEFQYDSQRSMGLKYFAKLAEVKGVQLISLQKGRGTEQLAAFKDQFDVVDLGDRLDEAHGPFMDTAAIMMNLDLVISSDTSVPHLAGALGVPVWVPLGVVPDWRWLLKREDSPWYPTMRLFRQKRFNDWDEVFTRMAEELKTIVPRAV